MADDLPDDSSCGSEDANIIEDIVAEPTLMPSPEYMEENIESQPQKVSTVEESERPIKRTRDMDGEEQWIMIGRDGKRTKQSVEITVTSSEKLPKQFALAKILNTYNITGITRVKFVNPYKVLVQFDDEKSSEQLNTCQQLQQLGWRCQKPLEVGISYGIIRNVELELNENDIQEAITTSYELVAVKRLKRRNAGGTGWIDSETVRLAFKGPTLPLHVSIHRMKIRVDPYVFPVTQCSRCWHFGHTLRACPAKKETCPKCTKNHANCEIKLFTCINCRGDHHALDRLCPAFRREKGIRDIMAQYNCSYRKAKLMYVPPPTLPHVIEKSFPAPNQDSLLPEPSESNQSERDLSSYATALQKPKTITTSLNVSGTSKQNKQVPLGPILSQRTLQKSKSKKNSKKQGQVDDWNMSDSDAMPANDTNQPGGQGQDKSKRDKIRISELTFTQLLERLKAIIFSDEYVDIMAKIRHVVSLFMDWLTSSAVKYLCDLPFKINFNS